MRHLAAAALVALAGITAAAATAHAQKGRMGEVADVSPGKTTPVVLLATFGRGELIFEKFGHTALCLDYNEPGRESVCFNYGVTEFGSSPAILVWNFLRGHQKFFVEPVPLTGMVEFYSGIGACEPDPGQRARQPVCFDPEALAIVGDISKRSSRWEDRSIWVQKLPLSESEARAIETKLLFDILPENRFYYYDHFDNNCTTRLRDIIDKAVGGKLRKGADVAYPKTFREMGMSGLAELPPIIAFGDFAVGRTLDVHPTLYQAMYHPFILMNEVDKRLGAPPTQIYERQGPPIPDHGPTDRPWALLIGLLFALPLVAAKLFGRLERAAVAVAAVPIALVGTLIWTAAIISTIPGLRWNEAVFLYVPFDFVLPFLGSERRRKYARVRVATVIAVSLLRAVGLFLQPLWVPIVIAFVIHGLIAFELPLPPLGKRAARA